jgi:hypothetical protein
MNLKLTSEDRNAINLLLDEAAAASSARSQGFATASGAEHLQAVRRVFHFLNVLPALEAPADLVSRTLARIGEARGQISGGKILATPPARHVTDAQANRPA